MKRKGGQPSILQAFGQASAKKRDAGQSTPVDLDLVVVEGNQASQLECCSNQSQLDKPVDRDQQTDTVSSPRDISEVAKSSAGAIERLSDKEKNDLVCSRKPSEHTKLPSNEYTDRRRVSGVTVRQCNRGWFDQFPFTSFSEKAQGIFCLPCVLFPVSPQNPGAKRSQLLITKPLTNWKNAKEDLTAHGSLIYHLQSAARLDEFLRVFRQPAARIENVLPVQAQAIAKRNQAVLVSVAKCLELCARQGIALRGHRDDSTSTALNQGNFRALVTFRSETDAVLADHLQNAPKNATYISKTVQNDLLEVMGDFILGKIVDEVKESKHYAIEADEVTDTANWEQLGIVVRYVLAGKAKEKLLGYANCESISGEHIYQILVEELTKAGLDLQFCRAQAYYGAGNMAGRVKGCQARFQEAYPLAKYFHCASHQLNLVLTHSCQQKDVHIMMEKLKSVGLFFQFSPKRQRELEKAIADMNDSQADPVRLKKIKTLCETRWVERHTSLQDFAVLYPAILDCLEDISSNMHGSWNSKSVTEATGLYHTIAADSFIAAFQTALFFTGYLKALSLLLQGSSLDVIVAYEEVDLVKGTLKEIRDDVEKEFDSVFDSMCQMAKQAGNDAGVGLPRRCHRQTQRSNVAADTPKDYWRRTVFIPFLDHLLNELNSRFSALTKASVRGLLLLPAKAKGMDVTKVCADVLEAYRADLPDPDGLVAELRLWKRKWASISVTEGTIIPQNLDETLAAVSGQELLFPNVVQVLKLLLITPVTTASVERSNSSLDFVKSERRSTMAQARLNSLLRLYVHKDIAVDFNQVITMYANKHPRRMLLSKPLEAES